MKILIIGGAGFLGLNLAKTLVNAKHAVHLLDKSFRSVKVHSIVTEMSGLHEMDCNNLEEILGVIDAQQIECVINLASGLLPASSFEAFDGEFRNILLPGFRLINELACKNIKYVYFSSGGTVYGQPDSDFVHEYNLNKPINLYGLSKAYFEQYISFVSRTSGLDFLILRPSNPYGFYQNPMRKQGLIAVVVDKILKGEAIEIWGDGSIIRDYIWAEDLVDAVGQLLERNIWNETFNVGSGVGSSVNDVIKTIEDVSGVAAHCRFLESRSTDVSRIVLDVSKLRSVISFEPLMLQNGIRQYMEGLRLASA